MKKNVLLIIISLLSLNSYSQTGSEILEEANWLENWTNFKPAKEEYRKADKILLGLITDNTTLSNRHTYLLKGSVYVTNNATLTIEPGTVIRGDYESYGTLVITKGAKIISEGTHLNPIVFTSNKERSRRKPGDWGGLIVMGDAPINTFGGVSGLDFGIQPKFSIYGGENAESSSGILKYIRIEYSGRSASSDKKLSGILFAGVGSKTIIENIQVSFASDDSFEFYGGNIKVNNLVSYKASDDDFDFTKGTQSIINNSIAIRSPYASGNDSPRAIEIDSYDEPKNFDPSRKKTNVKGNNVTLVNIQDNDQGLVKEAIYLEKDSYLNLINSNVYGFKDFIVVNDIFILEEFEEYVKLKDVRISHCKKDFSLNFEDLILDLPVKNYNYSMHNVRVTDEKIDDFFINPKMKYTPDFRHISLIKNMNNIVLN
ncbi:hypothetical protein N7U66_18375 [Lacinutrix neustonica]|uniref:T9SS C-terminal target domain-containing protein n=1 Tax=Lacinutrix neustonica TaxID=2980107 RepID=A0A9E8MUN8_9FLAO|nr:hypothetical protein [Lacinutrix neustonica]WAC01823.1 hypothetical protein N7U66_18375 [Lacinutrix neustonica]